MTLLEQRETLLEAWMQAYENDVLRLCFLYLHDLPLAEDALQETFVKVWRGMDRFERRGGCSPRTWIMHIAVNTCRDHLRTRWFRQRRESLPLEEAALLTDGPAMPDGSLFSAVMALPLRYREAVLLHFYQGMTVGDCARALHISRATCHKRLKKACELLRVDLEGGPLHD